LSFHGGNICCVFLALVLRGGFFGSLVPGMAIVLYFPVPIFFLHRGFIFRCRCSRCSFSPTYSHVGHLYVSLLVARCFLFCVVLRCFLFPLWFVTLCLLVALFLCL